MMESAHLECWLRGQSTRQLLLLLLMLRTQTRRGGGRLPSVPLLLLLHFELLSCLGPFLWLLLLLSVRIDTAEFESLGRAKQRKC